MVASDCLDFPPKKHVQSLLALRKTLKVNSTPHIANYAYYQFAVTNLCNIYVVVQVLMTFVNIVYLNSLSF